MGSTIVSLPLTSNLWILFGVGSSPLELSVIKNQIGSLSRFFFLGIFLTFLLVPQVFGTKSVLVLLLPGPPRRVTHGRRWRILLRLRSAYTRLSWAAHIVQRGREGADKSDIPSSYAHALRSEMDRRYFFPFRPDDSLTFYNGYFQIFKYPPFF